jgi:hypothetical protein
MKLDNCDQSDIAVLKDFPGDMVKCLKVIEDMQKKEESWVMP